MISRILFADELACISPEHCLQVCGSASGCSNLAYPRLVMSLMPVGLRGLMMAVIIAALMSDLDSIFNSASTIFTLDIYTMLRKQASSRELVMVGRLFVVFMVIASIAWVPVIIEMQGGQMFYYIQEVTDYLTPPVAATFLLAVLWHRCNETGAFWGGLVGFALGAARLILALVYREPHCDQPDERPSFIKDVHFMYVAAILFWASALVTVVVSLCTPPPTKEQIRNTTLWGLNKRRGLKHGTHKAAPPSNSYAIEAADTETHFSSPSPISDLKILDEGEERGVTVGKEEEEGWLGRGGGGGGGEHGRCVETLMCLCGLKEKPTAAQVLTVQEQEQIVDELLREPPRTRILLNIALVVICSVGVFLFIYFSV